MLRGLDCCRARSIGAVWADGPLKFFQRVGFRLLQRAWPSLSSPWRRLERDMALEIIPGTLAAARGVVRYPPQAWQATMGDAPSFDSASTPDARAARESAA